MFSGCSQGQKVVKVEVSEKVQSLFEIISGYGWAERSSGRETVCVPDLITHDQTNHHCPLQIFSSQDPDNNQISNFLLSFARYRERGVRHIGELNAEMTGGDGLTPGEEILQ